MTTPTETTQQSEPLRLDVRGVPLLYAGDELIAAITGWAGASLGEQTEWANRLMTAVNERPNLLEKNMRLEAALRSAKQLIHPADLRLYPKVAAQIDAALAE